MADSGRWREMKKQMETQFPEARVTSTYRPGSQGSSGPDYHSTGDAIDTHGPDLMAIFNWVAANFPQTAEIIYTPAGNRQIKNGQPHLYSPDVAQGHYDHVHWANPAGTPATGASGGGGFGGVSAFAGFLSNKSMWARVGVAVAAVVIGLVALARLTDGKVDAITPAKKALRTAGKKTGLAHGK